jgi:hypothetical protein
LEVQFRLSLLTAVLLVIAACGRGDRAAELAGLRIDHELEPPPDGSFWAPIDIAASDDRIWVLDVGAACVYGYDRSGAYQLTVGNKGGGPGELKEPLALGVMGDTLWVLNSGNRRVEYYSITGAPLGSDPLPDSLPPPVDLVRWADQWFASTPFRPGPVVRFDLAGGVAHPFGSELQTRARELADKGAIPNVYRLEVVDGRLWVMHLYLPLVGVYDPLGRLLRLMAYPGPKVEGEQPVEQELGEGRVRRVLGAPRSPAGGLGLLHDGEDRYLLTHQRSGDRQRMYRLDPAGVSERATLTPAGAFFLTSVVSDGKTYAIGTRGEDEEPTVIILE